MKIWTLSETGSIRKNNEDAVYGNIETGFFVIADGMGGHEAGEIASNMSIEKIRMELENLPEVNDAKLEEAIQNTNKLIYDSSNKQGQRVSMGTTLTFLKLIGLSGYVGHVGDSRLYILRNQQFVQLTEDHTYVEKLYQEGVISLEEYKNHPKKNVLLKALGSNRPIEPQIFNLNLIEGDIVFMCSDGVYNVLDDEEIATLLLQNSGSKRAEVFKEIIDQRGANDNYSMLILDEIREVK